MTPDLPSAAVRVLSLHVFTFKEGLLSRVAHDLRLRAERSLCRVDGAAVELEVEVTGLRVEGAMRDGALRPDELSPKDKAEIERTLQETILDAARHPRVHFRGRLTGARLEGELQLRGRSLSVSIPVHHADGRVRGTVELQPSRWGIAPYRALLGAIRLQDRVLVAFEAEAPPAPPSPFR